ncbi:MAG: DNA helicase II [Gammaproteobacteria bacterium]|nr:MAG: DNA helicase II [Gammaproteobacteria bacterium]
MDVTDILDSLNPQQREAVAAPPGPLLVLAGAGSGKTRVLTHRVAWLVGVESASPQSVLAVTFTNKAAQEMRGRIERLLRYPVNGLWVGTFHGISHRLLRAHWRDADLPEGFRILDSEDQYRLIRRILKNLELDEAYWQPRRLQWFINTQKEEGRRARDLGDGDDPQLRQQVRIYRAYEETCQRSGLVDFAELLLRVLELLRNNETMRSHYQGRFKHVLVDELQDTNAMQYSWLKLFAEAHNNLFVVGDDDQSIYGWRGARVENMLRFEQDFPGTQVIRLEQNYRSTATILEAANAVISYNDGRLGKKLWTRGEKGEPIRLYTAFNEIDEARFVVDRIQQWVDAGHRGQEVAILYRSNAQSRVFEETLLDVRIPYRVYGGMRFFERAEIKDALAYLRLVASRHDDPSFERVANVPTRGIGGRSMDALREQAKNQGNSLWDAARQLIAAGALPARGANALSAFLKLIDALARDTEGLELAELIDQVLQHSGLLDHHKKEKGEQAEARVENLEELVSAARNYSYDDDDDMDALSAFLAHAALEAGEGQAREWEDCVQLMSLHAAKGLEFPLVFLTGLEEGLFPHQRSIAEPGRLEEERRLCYVGMTRAMRQLYLSYAESRRLHGSEHYASPSRFLGELPTELVDELRAQPQFARPWPQARRTKADPAAASMAMPLGQRVRHAKFGEGVVTGSEGRGTHARVQVNFRGAGSKWLVLAYAKLQQL